MKKIITIYREGKYEVEGEIREAAEEIIDSLPDYANKQYVVIMEVHEEGK